MQDWLNDHQGLLALLALIAAIVLGVGAIFATRIWGERRGRILVTIDGTSIDVPSGLSSSLEITSDGRRVSAPLIALIELSNVGPRDLPSASFDSSNPISVHVPGLTPISAASNPRDLVAQVRDDSIHVGPAHLARGGSWLVHVLFDGAPSGSPEVRATIVDFDVVLGSRSQSRQQMLDVLVATVPFPFSVLVRLAAGVAGSPRV